MFEAEIKKLRPIAIDQVVQLNRDPHGCHGASHWKMVAATIRNQIPLGDYDFQQFAAFNTTNSILQFP